MPAFCRPMSAGFRPSSRYNRFFGALSELPLAELDRVIHLDQKYQLALLRPASMAHRL